MTATIASYLNFFWAGLRRQRQTGGIVPSQGFLIAKMIAPVPRNYCGQIVELGAGNGALTVELAARCPEARILACEINPTLARDCRRNVAKAGYAGRVEVVNIGAEQLFSEMSQHGDVVKPAFIISGIPFGNIGRMKAARLLDVIRDHLGAGGMFIQFQHSLLERARIRARFPNTRTVPALLNFPPAVVYYAQR